MNTHITTPASPHTQAERLELYAKAKAEAILCQTAAEALAQNNPSPIWVNAAHTITEAFGTLAGSGLLWNSLVTSLASQNPAQTPMDFTSIQTEPLLTEFSSALHAFASTTPGSPTSEKFLDVLIQVYAQLKSQG